MSAWLLALGFAGAGPAGAEEQTAAAAEFAGTYAGMARNGNYQGRMVLALSGSQYSLRAVARWSDGLEGEAELAGGLMGRQADLGGTLRYQGRNYPISIQMQLGDGRAQGYYRLDLGDAGGKQRGEFSLTQGSAQKPAAVKAPAGNPVEPISNGLALTMTRSEILQRFGEPKPNWDRCMMQYPGFRVVCGGARSGIWHFFLTEPGVTLNSGIGVGSSRQEVARALGNPYGGVIGQYKLDIEYDGDRVARIGIDPAEGEFKPQTAKAADPKPAPAANDMVGLYWCVAPSWSKGTINLLPDGNYQMNGKDMGRYRVEPGRVRFEGLSSWNNGVARIESGNLIFEWQNADGAKQYFAYAKGRD